MKPKRDTALTTRSPRLAAPALGQRARRPAPAQARSKGVGQLGPQALREELPAHAEPEPLEVPPVPKRSAGWEPVPPEVDGAIGRRSAAVSSGPAAAGSSVAAAGRGRHSRAPSRIPPTTSGGTGWEPAGRVGGTESRWETGSPGALEGPPVPKGNADWEAAHPAAGHELALTQKLKKGVEQLGTQGLRKELPAHAGPEAGAPGALAGELRAGQGAMLAGVTELLRAVVAAQREVAREFRAYQGEMMAGNAELLRALADARREAASARAEAARMRSQMAHLSNSQ